MNTVILGSGPLGLAVMEAEVAKGNKVVLVNTTGFIREAVPSHVQIVKQDIRDPQGLMTAIPEADVVFNCTRPQGLATLETLQSLANGALVFAQGKNALLIHCDQFFAYGDAMGIPISESSPEKADAGPLGPLYKQVKKEILDAHFSGKVRVMIARSPQAYGPRVLKGPLASDVFGRLLQRKDAIMLGSLDLPHSFGYIKDMGKNLSLLAEHPEAAGKVWHLPCSPALTQQQILDILRDMLSRNVYAQLIKTPRGLASLFSKDHKAHEDILYQYEKPFVSNHTRFSTTFGERCTAHPQALWETLEWYRHHGLGI